MKELIEWLFEFRVTSLDGVPISRKEMEAFLEVAPVEWEDKHDLFAGFGLDSLAKSQVTWLCHIPVCANHDGQLVSEAQCMELLTHYTAYCSERGWGLEGGFREFTKEEKRREQ
jgi:hypothetical protein